MTTKELGDIGEEIARNYLVKKGVKILDLNYRYHRNEIDIIYKLPDKIVFVEVKTRQTSQLGPPWKAITLQKQRTIIKCAHHYLVSKDLNEEAQFDVISIIHNSYGTDIEHITDAFYPRI